MIRTNDHDGVRTTKEDRPTCARWICALPRISSSTVDFVDAPPLKHFWRTLLERAASFAGVSSAITASSLLPGCNFSCFYPPIPYRPSPFSRWSLEDFGKEDASGRRTFPFRKRKLNRSIGTKRRIAAFQGQSWQSLRESFGIFPASNVHHVPLSWSLSRDHPYIARLAWNCSTVESHSRGSSRQPHHTRSSIVDYCSSVEKKTLFLKTVEGIRNEGGGNYRTSLSITFSMAFTGLLI